jgi:putative aminopeptidase FrvX
MVRSINGDGTLNVTRVGGPQLATLDGEYCKIQTRFNKTIYIRRKPIIWLFYFV